MRDKKAKVQEKAMSLSGTLENIHTYNASSTKNTQNVKITHLLHNTPNKNLYTI